MAQLRTRTVEGNNGRKYRIPSALVAMKEGRGGFPVGFVELGGTVYKIETAQSNKEGIVGWVKLTKTRARSSGSGRTYSRRRRSYSR